MDESDWALKLRQYKERLDVIADHRLYVPYHLLWQARRSYDRLVNRIDFDLPRCAEAVEAVLVAQIEMLESKLLMDILKGK